MTTPPLSDALKARIDWLINQRHVGESDAEIRADMYKRMKDASPSLRQQVIRYALRRHHRNQRFFVRVMRGSI
jgi:chromosomal replication initiation ATPase DnaA